jgi:hypothetical protein
VVPGSKLPNHSLHIKSPKEHEELVKQVEEVNLLESIAIFHEKEEPLEEVNLSDSLAILYDNSIHYVIDKTPEDKVHDFSVEPIDYVDFIGIDAILSNSSNQVCDEIFMAEGNVLSKGDRVIASYLRIFMAYGKDKALEKNDKFEVLPSGVWGFHDKRQGTPMMRSITLIMRCCLVLILREGESNELTGHPKDRGKNRLNSRANSLQPREDDVDQDAWEYLRKTRANANVKTPRKMVTRAQMRTATEPRPDGPCARL